MATTLGLLLLAAISAMLLILAVRQRTRLRLLQQQNEALQAEGQKLYSIVSHDIKGPFNRIFALLQLLQMNDEAFTPAQLEYLDRIYIVVADGQNMLRNLGEARKLNMSSEPPRTERVRLDTLVQQLVKQYQLVAARKKLTVEWQITAPVEITAERNFAQRIVENLISNAVKFSTPGKAVRVWCKEEASFGVVAVADEGPGLTPDDERHLFQRFQKLSAAPTAGESQTGLGLAISQQLITMMGGKIAGANNDAGGSTFTAFFAK